MRDWLTYPGISRQDWGQRLRWWRKPALIVLHSTEGSSYPGYSGGASAPHFTVHCRARTCRQHIPLSSAARALKASLLGQTNRSGAIQIEIIGTCVVGGRPSVLNLDDGDLAYLGGLLRTISAETGIPLTTSVRWSAYPASYGRWPGRLGWLTWWRYRGVLGHQHVPGNSHGDPGSLNIARLLDLAQPPSRDWFDMATKAELSALLTPIAKVAAHADDVALQLRAALLTETGPGTGVFTAAQLEKRIAAAAAEIVLAAITTPPPAV